MRGAGNMCGTKRATMRYSKGMQYEPHKISIAGDGEWDSVPALPKSG